MYFSWTLRDAPLHVQWFQDTGDEEKLVFTICYVHLHGSLPKISVFFTFLLHHHRKWNETTETILKKLVLKLNNVEKPWFQFDISHSISKYFYEFIATLQKPHSIKYTFQPSKYRKFHVKRKLFVVLFWNVI